MKYVSKDGKTFNNIEECERWESYPFVWVVLNIGIRSVLVERFFLLEEEADLYIKEMECLRKSSTRCWIKQPFTISPYEPGKKPCQTVFDTRPPYIEPNSFKNRRSTLWESIKNILEKWR